MQTKVENLVEVLAVGWERFSQYCMSKSCCWLMLTHTLPPFPGPAVHHFELSSHVYFPPAHLYGSFFLSAYLLFFLTSFLLCPFSGGLSFVELYCICGLFSGLSSHMKIILFNTCDFVDYLWNPFCLCGLFCKLSLPVEYT